jgi:flagellar biogenesis protein FliO
MSGVRTFALTLAVALAAMIVVAPAVAQDATEQAAPADEGGYLPETETAPASLSVLDVAGKLVIALVVGYGIIRGIRWWQESRLNVSGEGRGGRRMWLEETLSLGTDGRLYLVEVEGRRMLLAARDGSVAEVAKVTEEPVRPNAYRSVRKRSDGSTDELNVRQADISTRSVRPDLVEEDESWEKRRGRLLRELQEQG